MYRFEGAEVLAVWRTMEGAQGEVERLTALHAPAVYDYVPKPLRG